jgi:hypothetical protein
MLPLSIVTVSNGRVTVYLNSSTLFVFPEDIPQVFTSGRVVVSCRQAMIWPLPVVCGLGKSRLISGVYSEQCERRLPLCDGFKARQNPESTNYR